MPKDDAIGAPREIPANRLLLGLRTGLRSGAIGALRTQMTGVAGPLGLHARRESQALEPVTVLKAALDGARARTLQIGTFGSLCGAPIGSHWCPYEPR